MNDSSACLTAEAIFEVKTMTGCNSRYNHNNDNIRPVDRRANGVRVEYKGKFGKFDHRFAHDFIGPRDVNGNFVGPFSLAQQRFFTKQIIPLVAGCFGDLGTDFENKTIRTVAWKASGTIDGLELETSPARGQVQIPLLFVQPRWSALPCIIRCDNGDYYATLFLLAFIFASTCI